LPRCVLVLPGRLLAWTAHTAYWISYLDMVEILLEMMRASRKGNWPLHHHAIRMMIPWCATYDKVNYARYLSIYHAQMTRLEEEHPDIYHHMMEGARHFCSTEFIQPVW